MIASFAIIIFTVGENPGLGQLCKVVNNAISIVGNAIVCESIVMGVKSVRRGHPGQRAELQPRPQLCDLGGWERHVVL